MRKKIASCLLFGLMTISAVTLTKTPIQADLLEEFNDYGDKKINSCLMVVENKSTLRL